MAPDGRWAICAQHLVAPVNGVPGASRCQGHALQVHPLSNHVGQCPTQGGKTLDNRNDYQQWPQWWPWQQASQGQKPPFGPPWGFQGPWAPGGGQPNPTNQQTEAPPEGAEDAESGSRGEEYGNQSQYGWFGGYPQGQPGSPWGQNFWNYGSPWGQNPWNHQGFNSPWAYNSSSYSNNFNYPYSGNFGGNPHPSSGYNAQYQNPSFQPWLWQHGSPQGNTWNFWNRHSQWNSQRPWAYGSPWNAWSQGSQNPWRFSSPYAFPRQGWGFERPYWEPANYGACMGQHQGPFQFGSPCEWSAGSYPGWSEFGTVA